MRRRLALLGAALAALLVLAPAAFASTYTVTDPTDPAASPDLIPGDDHCDVDAGTLGDQCTLRAAIEEANAHAGADTIAFDPAARAVQAQTAFSGGDAVTGTTTIDGAGATTVTFAAAADGPLLVVSGGSSVLKGLTFTGGKSGPMLELDGSSAQLDHVSIHDTPGTAVLSTASSAQLASVAVSKAGAPGISIKGADAFLTSPVVSAVPGSGIAISGLRASVSKPDVSGAVDGILVTGAGVHISGGTSHGNSASGVYVDAQGVVVSALVLYDDAGRPLVLAPGANSGITPPPDLRIGPRRPDGTLPLNGSAGVGGVIELWSGSPFGSLAPSLLDAFTVSGGGFTYNFASEPAPGATFAVTLTGDGTSEFETVTAPSDIVSPDIVKARALSTTDVRVFPSEPIDPGSVQPADFALTMAGQDRTINAAAAAPDGSYVDLTSSGWKAGEAGYVQLSGAGAINDSAGNASLATTRLRVAAAPGDFIAPIAGQLVFSPSNICLTHGRGCRTTGTVIRFVSTEPGKATVVVQRGDKRLGTRLYNTVDAGANELKFNGRISGRKLRAGRYRVLLYVQDQVGNVTDQPPIALLTVRRVTK